MTSPRMRQKIQVGQKLPSPYSPPVYEASKSPIKTNTPTSRITPTTGMMNFCSATIVACPYNAATTNATETTA